MRNAIYGVAAVMGLMAFDTPSQAQGISFGYSNFGNNSSFGFGYNSGGYRPAPFGPVGNPAYGTIYGGHVYPARPAPVYVPYPVYRPVPVPYYGGYGPYVPYSPYYGPRW